MLALRAESQLLWKQVGNALFSFSAVAEQKPRAVFNKPSEKLWSRRGHRYHLCTTWRHFPGKLVPPLTAATFIRYLSRPVKIRDELDLADELKCEKVLTEVD